MPMRIAFILPRLTAWVLVVLGVGWFIHASPKTPLEFFDAVVGDGDAIRAREMEEYERIDPAVAAEIRRCDELLTYSRQMDRIALLHDLADAPQRVRSQKSWIVDGIYIRDEGTDEKMKASDEEYRTLAKKLEERRAEIDADEASASRRKSLREAATRSGVYNTTHRMAIDRQQLRYFQAWLFWW
jgi:hypothetical protein